MRFSQLLSNQSHKIYAYVFRTWARLGQLQRRGTCFVRINFRQILMECVATDENRGYVKLNTINVHIFQLYISVIHIYVYVCMYVCMRG